MNMLGRIGWTAVGLVLLAFVADAQSLSNPQDGAPMEVTSDTRDYCRHLRQELELSRDPPEEVRILTAEGWRMCSQGQVVGGLVRLRRAVTILRDGARGR